MQAAAAGEVRRASGVVPARRYHRVLAVPLVARRLPRVFTPLMMGGITELFASEDQELRQVRACVRACVCVCVCVCVRCSCCGCCCTIIIIISSCSFVLLECCCCGGMVHNVVQRCF